MSVEAIIHRRAIRLHNRSQAGAALYVVTTVTIEKSGYRVNDVQQPEIVLTSGEKKLKFGAMGLPNEVQTYVAAVLRRAAGGG